jgi:hypothetical protein
MAERGSSDARDAPRYLVEIPFRAARNGRLTRAPYELPDGARIEQTVLEDVTPSDKRRTVLEQVHQTFVQTGLPFNPRRTPVLRLTRSGRCTGIA